MGLCWESWVGAMRVTRMIFQDCFRGWILGLGGFGLGIKDFIDDFSRWFLRLGVGGSAWLENRNGHH